MIGVPSLVNDRKLLKLYIKTKREKEYISFKKKKKKKKSEKKIVEKTWKSIESAFPDEMRSDFQFCCF